MEIHVVAKQWMWKLQHPNGLREINMLHVPVNEPVRLVMTSQDVIHSFSVPDFRIKQDILPGRIVEAWFQATKTGSFRLYCTQFCGTAHSAMTGSIVVMSKPDFAAWLSAEPSSGDLVAEGRALFVSLGCAGCHTPGGPVHAPDLAGIFGRRVPLANGDFALVDDAYIRDRILFPKAQSAGRLRSHHALVQGRSRRRADPRAHRLHPLASAANRSFAMTDAVAPFTDAEPRHEEGTTGSYLDAHGSGFSEWLLTTDHKRIAHSLRRADHRLLFHWRSGGDLIRLELFSPTPRLLTDDGYNRVFTLHGIIMVWFFLVPLIPTTFGNFLLPLMIGAPDVAFPRLNLASWYLTLIGGLCALAALLMGGVDTGWTFYPPYSTSFSHEQRRDRRLRRLHRRLRLIADRGQFHRHDAHAAGAGHDLVPPAAVRLGDLRDEPRDDFGDAGARDDAVAGRGGPMVRPADLRPGFAAAIRCFSSTSSGSIRIPRSTS